MNRVEEIETAIDGLSSEDYRRIVEWVLAREREHWDGQIDRDSAALKLDVLFEEAEREAKLLRDWFASGRSEIRIRSCPSGVGTSYRLFRVQSLTRTRLVIVRVAATGPYCAYRLASS